MGKRTFKNKRKTGEEMKDQELFDKLDEFQRMAQSAREYNWGNYAMNVDMTLDQLILAIYNFRAKRETEEMQSL